MTTGVLYLNAAAWAAAAVVVLTGSVGEWGDPVSRNRAILLNLVVRLFAFAIVGGILIMTIDGSDESMRSAESLVVAIFIVLAVAASIAAKRELLTSGNLERPWLHTSTWRFDAASAVAALGIGSAALGWLVVLIISESDPDAVFTPVLVALIVGFAYSYIAELMTRRSYARKWTPQLIRAVESDGRLTAEKVEITIQRRESNIASLKLIAVRLEDSWYMRKPYARELEMYVEWAARRADHPPIELVERRLYIKQPFRKTGAFSVVQSGINRRKTLLEPDYGKVEKFAVESRLVRVSATELRACGLKVVETIEI